MRRKAKAAAGGCSLSFWLKSNREPRAPARLERHSPVTACVRRQPANGLATAIPILPAEFSTAAPNKNSELQTF